MTWRWIAAFLVLGVLASTALMVSRYPRSISDPVRLRSVRSEAMDLMTRYATPRGSKSNFVSVPQNRLPAAIAALQAERVTVDAGMVDISIRSYFDGGWGYHIPKNRTDLPMPAECYSEPLSGVFWHGPC